MAMRYLLPLALVMFPAASIAGGGWSGAQSVAGGLLAANNLSDVANAATSRTNLGVEIGVDTQAHGAVLDDLNTLGAVGADGDLLVGTGAGAFAYENGATARASLGLGTAAVVNTGVALGEVPLMDATGYPAADGSQITGITAKLPFTLVETTHIDYDADVDGAPTANGMTCSGGGCSANGIYYETTNGTIAYSSGNADDGVMGLYYRFDGVFGGNGLPCRMEVYTGERRIDFYVTVGGALWTVTPSTKIHTGAADFDTTRHTIEIWIPAGSASVYWAVDGALPSDTTRQGLSGFASDATNYGFAGGWFSSSGTAFQVAEFELRVIRQ